MKKTIGFVSLAAIISTGAFAEDAAPTTPTPTPSSDTAVTAAAPQPAPAIDCSYTIPSGTKQIDPAVITQWAEKAAIQSFDYDFNTLDGQLDKLKACFTDEGWTGFNDALKKSGNIDAIKSQHLAVSAMATGKPAMQTIKENQWKFTIPMQVVYQNSEEKLTQKLSVDVLVGRKPSGNLGILQMIAIPEKANADAQTAQTPASTTETPATTPAATTTTPDTTATPATTTPDATATPAATTPQTTTPVTPGAVTPETPAVTTTPATPTTAPATTPTTPTTPATNAQPVTTQQQ